MNVFRVLIFIGFGFAALTANGLSHACTNLLVSKGASTDGSTMISYAADSHTLYGELYFTPASSHIPGEMRDIYDWDTGKYLSRIPQPPHTYSVVGNMNEHQLAIAETTFGGRKELVDAQGGIDYGSLIYVTLERARNAKEAIEIMTSLVAEHGYSSSGESFSISDPDEAWIMEMIGKGTGNKGAVWVARRIPDGYISAHANASRIRNFPLNDEKNCIYSDDVISFAREKGYFLGKDEEFSFADAYAPLSFSSLRFCEARVWAAFNRAAPSQKLSSDWIKGVSGAQPLPLWIKPDRKLDLRDMTSLMRDHFEGTELDMTGDVGAGPFKLPYRWRPLSWKVDGKKYLNERAISTQQTAFSFVAQSRGWLPDPIGGILWFGVDDTASTVYVPFYCGILKTPKSWGTESGSFNEFSWESAFWVFNFVSNWAYQRYSDMIVDIQKVQHKLEGTFAATHKDVDKAAVELYKRSPMLARDYLTGYSIEQAESTLQSWKELGERLIVKYLDGNVRDEHGKVTSPGYPEEWYRRIANDAGDRLEYRRLEGEPDPAAPRPRCHVVPGVFRPVQCIPEVP